MSRKPYHISGKLHLTGTSRFIADEAGLPGMLQARFFFSPVAHARIISMDVSEAEAVQGVERVITAADIPGENQIGHVIKDEPLFPESEIMYLGQPLAMVLADDEILAEEAAKLIRLEYEELPPLLGIDEADARSEWYVPERKIERGETDRALSEAALTLTGIP